MEKFDETSIQELLQDVYEKVPIGNKKSDKKLVEVVNGLSEAYTKEPPGLAGRTTAPLQKHFRINNLKKNLIAMITK